MMKYLLLFSIGTFLGVLVRILFKLYKNRDTKKM